MPQPPILQVNCLQSLRTDKEVTFTPWETAETFIAPHIIRSLLTPVIPNGLLPKVTIRRVPLVPLTQHRSQPPASLYRGVCVSPRTTDHEYASPLCRSPNTMSNGTVFSPRSNTSTTQGAAMSPRSPLVTPQTSPRSNGSPQWVLLDSLVERSSSPELLHLCDSCDAEFSSVGELKRHSENCKKPKIVPVKARRTSQAKQTFRGHKNSIKPLKRVINNNDANITNNNLIAPRVPSYNVELQKEAFFKTLGMQRRTLEEKKRVPVVPPQMSNLKQMTLFRPLPFTHIPTELRLRNQSFNPSSRIESQNLELILNNWKKVDKLCPAYPECHRKFIDYAYDFEEKRRKTAIRLGAQALALKRSLKQPRLIIRRLTPQEIRLACQGINTKALMKRTEQDVRRKQVKRKRKSRAVPACKKVAVGVSKAPVPRVVTCPQATKVVAAPIVHTPSSFDLRAASSELTSENTTSHLESRVVVNTNIGHQTIAESPMEDSRCSSPCSVICIDDELPELVDTYEQPEVLDMAAALQRIEADGENDDAAKSIFLPVEPLGTNFTGKFPYVKLRRLEDHEIEYWTSRRCSTLTFPPQS